MPNDFTYPVDSYLLIGKVVEAHGLKGEVVVLSFAGQPENFRRYSKLTLVSQSGRMCSPCSTKVSRVKGKSAIMRFESCPDRNAAETIAGMGVLVDKNDIPQPDEGEFYLYQLEGLTVFTDTGRRLGKVVHIFANTAQHILVVQDESKEYLIPFVKALIVQQDAEKIVISPPPGLLDINSGEEIGE